MNNLLLLVRAYLQKKRAPMWLGHPVPWLKEPEELLRADSWVRRAAKVDQLPQQDPKAPHIWLGGVKVVGQRLWCHPFHGHCNNQWFKWYQILGSLTFSWAFFPICLVDINISSQPKICYFTDLSLCQENVAHSQVSVDQLKHGQDNQFVLPVSDFTFISARYAIPLAICQAKLMISFCLITTISSSNMLALAAAVDVDQPAVFEDILDTVLPTSGLCLLLLK